MKILKQVATEPLVPIIVVGLGLFFIWSALKPDRTETIEIRPEVIQFKENFQVELLGRELTDQERQEVIDSHIDDEVLLREAYKRGFGTSDPRVRKRLLAVMRYALDESIPAPSIAQLQAYYQENRERFVNAESIDFEVITFGPSSAKTPADPTAFLAQVRGAAKPLALGDFRMSGNRRMQASERLIVKEFGRDFLERVWALPQNEWQGPIDSRIGLHYVRLLVRHPASYSEFEQIEDYLRQDWEFSKRRALQQEKIDELKSNYRIETVDATK